MMRAHVSNWLKVVWVPMLLRARARIAAAHAAEFSARAVDLVFNVAGGTAIFEQSPIERCFRDVHATTQHIATSAHNYEWARRVLLGHPAFLANRQIGSCLPRERECRNWSC